MMIMGWGLTRIVWLKSEMEEEKLNLGFELKLI